MKIEINIKTGNYPQRKDPEKKDIQESINAVEKAISGKPLTGYEQLVLVDVKGILIGIQEQLPGG